MVVPSAFTAAITAGAVLILAAVGAAMVTGLTIAGGIWGGKKIWKAFKGVTQ